MEIIAEFRLVTKSFNTDYDRFIKKLQLAELPVTGELINIDGEPYVVYERGSSYGEGVQFATVRVMGLQGSEQRLLERKASRT